MAKQDGVYTQIVNAASSKFLIKTTKEGDMVFMDKNGASTFFLGKIIDRVIFSDKAVNVDAVSIAALVKASDLPALDNKKELRLKMDAEQLKFVLEKRPFDDLPTDAIINLAFSRLFQQELNQEEARQWEKTLYDYIQQPEQKAEIVGLIHENHNVLFV